MRRWLVGAVLVAGCAEEGPPDLLASLTGSWTGRLATADLRSRPIVLLFGPAGEGEHFGYVRIWDDDPPRDYALDHAWSVEDQGVVLDFFETGGVRRLTLTAVVPLDPLVVGWEATWYCDEEPDRSCDQLGVAPLEPAD